MIISRKALSLLLCSLAFTLPCACQAQEAEDYLYAFSPIIQSTSRASYDSEPSPEELSKKQKETADFWGTLKAEKGDIFDQEDVVKLYQTASHYLVVQGLIGSVITDADNFRIGALRMKMCRDALEKIALDQTFGNRFGANELGTFGKVNAITPIELTLYCDNQSINGFQMVNQFRKIFTELAGIEPEKMDIAARNFEGSSPDWQKNRGTADDSHPLPDISLLEINPEAAFLESAFQIPLSGQRDEPGQKTFTWYSPDSNGKVTVQKVNAGLQKAFFNLSNVSDLYAWGSSVAYWHFSNARLGNVKALAADVIHSIDNGVGLKLGSQKTGNFIHLSPLQRQNLIHTLYESHFSPEDLDRIDAVLETAVNISKNSLADLTTQREMIKAYDPLIQIEKKYALIDLSEEHLLLMAIHSFHTYCRRILFENNLICTGSAFKNWLNPTLEPGHVLMFLYENGTAKKVSLSGELLESLRFSSLFEIRKILPLLNDSSIALFQKQNPASQEEIEIWLKLQSKQRELLSVPEKAPPQGLTKFREDKAIEVLSEYRQIKQMMSNSSFASPFWKNDQIPALNDEKFQEWLFGSIKERLSLVPEGTNYLPILRKLSLENQRRARPFPLLEERWLAGLDNTQSMIEILKAYVREGSISQNLLMTSLTEGLSFVPGIKILYSIKGDLVKAPEFTLVRSVSGFGEIKISGKVTNGSIVVVPIAAFSPIKNNQVKLAYTADKNTGKKDTPVSILFPVDPLGQLPLNEARENIYHYFAQHIFSLMTNDPGIWYSEEEKPKEWQQKEFETLKIFTAQYVQDWWDGKGPFTATAAPSRLKREDIRKQLNQQLLSDYLVGKAIALEKKIQEKADERQSLFDSLAEIAKIDSALDRESISQSGNFITAGNLILAHVLDQMPSIEPSVDLISVPQVTQITGQKGKTLKRYIADVINVRVSINGSLKNHPGPWKIRWKFQPVKDRSAKDKISTTMLGTAIDGNGREFASQFLNVEVKKIKIGKKITEGKENVSDDELMEELNEILAQLVAASESSSISAARAQSLCNLGKNKALQALAALDGFNSKFSSNRQTSDGLFIEIKEIKDQINDIEDYTKTINGSLKKIENAKNKADDLALKACGMLEEMTQNTTASKGKELHEELQDAKKEIQKLHKGALKDLSSAVDASQKIYRLRDAFKTVSQKVERLRNELGAIDFAIGTSKKNIEEAQDDFEGVNDELNHLSNQAFLASSLSEEAENLFKKIKTKSASLEKIKKEISYLDQTISSTFRDIQGCPKDLKKRLLEFNQRLEKLDWELQKGFDKVNELSGLIQKDNQPQKIESSSENAKASMFDIDLSWEALTARLHDAEKCETLGREAVDAITKLKMPDVRGTSVTDATNKLTEMKLKVNRIGGGAAPNDELSFKIESQIPIPGSIVRPGDVVTITIYGQHRETLPDVRGMSIKEATSKLSSLQLRVNRVGGDPAPSEELSFKIEFQHPAPGTKVIAGDTVTLTIYSTYSPIATMPNLSGLTREKAEEKLKALGLIPNIVIGDAASTKEKSNTVSSQSPEEGKQVPTGSEAIITVYGIFESAVPDVLGLSADSAGELIRSEGLKALIKIGNHASSADRENQVYQQYPLPGTKSVTEGVVEITVYGKYIEGGSFFKLPSKNTTPFYVICDSYMATPNTAPPSSSEEKAPQKNAMNELFNQLEAPGKSEEQKKHEEWINALTLQDVSFTASADPVIFKVDGEGLSYYDPSFFSHRKQLSTLLNMDLAENDNTYTINGALLLEVAGVFHTKEELLKARPDLEGAFNQGSAIIPLSFKNGTFRYSTVQGTKTIDLSGGPLREGWPLPMKERNLTMVKNIKLLFNCFIATAIYDSWTLPQLSTFRSFRDKVMLSSPSGKNLVHRYYSFGPNLAAHFYEHPALKTLCRPFFNSFAAILNFLNLESPSTQNAFHALFDVINFFYREETEVPVLLPH